MAQKDPQEALIREERGKISTEVLDVSVPSPGVQEAEQEDEPSPGQEPRCETASPALSKQTPRAAGWARGRHRDREGPARDTLSSRALVTEPWHRNLGAGVRQELPDSVMAAVLWPQPLSCCPQVAGRGQGVLAPGVWAALHTLLAGGQGVMDEACPGLQAEIIPHLSDVTLQDPSQGGLTALPGFSQGRGALGPSPQAASRWIYDHSHAPASRGQERQRDLYSFNTPF